MTSNVSSTGTKTSQGILIRQHKQQGQQYRCKTYRNGKVHVALSLLLVLSLLSFSTPLQSKKQLEKDKAKVEQEIKNLNSQLSKAKKNSKAGQQQLNLLERKIAERTKLINNLNGQLNLLNIRMTETEDSIALIRGQVDSMKLEYGKVVRALYRERGNLDKLVLVLDTKSYNYAYLRTKYFRDYSRYRRRQAMAIHQKERELSDVGEELRRQQRELQRQRKLPVQKTQKPDKPEESDTRILGRYSDIYIHPPKGSSLNDPQNLLTTVEKEDVEHVLRELNANSKFRIYVSVFKGGQDIPSELSVDMLVTATVQPCEYAVLMRYPTGNPAAIELGYQEINPAEARRHEWLQKVRTAAGDGSAEGLMSALRCISSQITPISDSFVPVITNTGRKPPKITIQYKENKKEKKRTIKDRIQEAIENPLIVSMVLYPLGILSSLVGLWFVFNWMRTSSKLVESEADLRLSSPYGAGVSRYVRYLEGTEAGKEKRLF